MKVILWILIIFAVLMIVVRKVRDFKAGKFCDCGCSDCPSKCKKAKEFKD
ncbi:MAG: FeoB-associated Cys-rich membrane protein [Clostridia bacterium]|nr:FeoB-associated Cys-rich membrane protein [Clostridia bacterium]